ncbi:hypothetical protein [Bartonella machadoae]|uniref:hypothetical protein n=1 Tax=Bartonella machadoae TaxID=2893471 RepID=UPI001F4CB8B4|nr:hypothetical protein [Bartonella machadoae]UNE54831.1 hypothetical protein LNM86_02885 [Bartonella machadoae]
MWGENRLERSKNAFNESSKYQGLLQHWGAVKSIDGAGLLLHKATSYYKSKNLEYQIFMGQWREGRDLFFCDCIQVRNKEKKFAPFIF